MENNKNQIETNSDSSSSCSECPSSDTSQTSHTSHSSNNCNLFTGFNNANSINSVYTETTNSFNNSNSNIFYSKNNPNNNNNPNNRNHIAICNKVTIDVAVLCQEYTTIEKMCNDHIINLDEIEITKDLFQCIFYPYYENFGINKNTICNNCFYQQYISFLPEYRSVNGKKFYLLEEIISNIESDLNISRNCFTVESLVELTNEIISINSFCDLNCCSVLSSLTWCNILEIIKNYSIINDNCGCAPDSNSSSSSNSTSSSSSSSSSMKQPVIPICVISVVFKTPTPGVKNTIVRFNYRITDL